MQEVIARTASVKNGCNFFGFHFRFLRDGYRTPKEDCARLYYERWELRMFENIECEWPVFYSYLILFHLFQGDKLAVSEYAQKLEVKIRSKNIVSSFASYSFFFPIKGNTGAHR